MQRPTPNPDYSRYRVIVLRETVGNGLDISSAARETGPGSPLILDREFTFSESSHKVEDIFNLAVEQAEREGGFG